MAPKFKKGDLVVVVEKDPKATIPRPIGSTFIIGDIDIHDDGIVYWCENWSKQTPVYWGSWENELDYPSKLHKVLL